MQRIKVLHIIKSLGRGGAEMLLPETLSLHDQSKFEFHYIYFLPWKNQMVTTIETNGGKVTCFNASNNIKILLKRNAIADYVVENKIDVIHCHLPWAGVLGRLVFRKTHVPTLYTEHNKQERYHILTKLLNRFTFNWQSMAIGVSDDVSNSIKKNIDPTIPVITILNGVNTDKFVRGATQSSVRSDLGIPEGALVVGTVAVFRFQKRLVEWLKVMKAVCDVNPNFYGVVVGDGPLKTEIMAAHKELKLEGRVFFAGLQEEVRPYFKAMNVFMMTSEFEGLPIALLEAMSMGCAIFTTNAGGVGEVVNSNEIGKCVDVTEWESLSQELLKHTNLEELGLMGENARRRVETAFSLKTMVNHLESLYESYGS